MAEWEKALRGLTREIGPGTSGPGGEERRAGLGDAWDWAGVGRGWAAREWARCWVDLGRVLAGFWAFWVLGFLLGFFPFYF